MQPENNFSTMTSLISLNQEITSETLFLHDAMDNAEEAKDYLAIRKIHDRINKLYEISAKIDEYMVIFTT